MRVVEPDLNEMLLHTHRRWINERTPEAETAFNKVLAAVFAKATQPRKD